MTEDPLLAKLNDILEHIGCHEDFGRQQEKRLDFRPKTEMMMTTRMTFTPWNQR